MIHEKGASRMVHLGAGWPYGVGGLRIPLQRKGNVRYIAVV
jgi:hypothetical protein